MNLAWSPPVWRAIEKERPDRGSAAGDSGMVKPMRGGGWGGGGNNINPLPSKPLNLRSNNDDHLEFQNKQLPRRGQVWIPIAGWVHRGLARSVRRRVAQVRNVVGVGLAMWERGGPTHAARAPEGGDAARF